MQVTVEFFFFCSDGTLVAVHGDRIAGDSDMHLVAAAAAVASVALCRRLCGAIAGCVGQHAVVVASNQNVHECASNRTSTDVLCVHAKNRMILYQKNNTHMPTVSTA